jgi:hypothetical protein
MPLMPTSIKIPKHLNEWYKARAKVEGIAQSELMRRALIDWTHEREYQQEAKKNRNHKSNGDK